MSSTVQRLTERSLIRPPSWLPSNVHYETLMGSQAYGVSNDESDFDIYGFCIPPKTLVFPHLAGEIPGFGRQLERFENFQQHHVHDPDALGGRGRSYDLTIFSIVKYFALAMENNPNMVDGLFAPQSCVLHQTRVGGMVRASRRLFLHKGAFHKFKGYAYSQLHKMRGERLGSRPDGKRKDTIEQYGFDVKFAYHVVRLIDEVEQILESGNLELGRNCEQLKAIRAGEWTEGQVREYFSQKERDLEALYARSELRHGPDEAAIKALLIACLEEHYQSLEGALVQPDAAVAALREIGAVVERHRGLTAAS
jgi:predicted nucleotidyltransferase